MCLRSPCQHELKVKIKLFAALKKGHNTKLQKLCKTNHSSANQAVFKQFAGLPSQNVPINWASMQEKALQYAKACYH